MYINDYCLLKWYLRSDPRFSSDFQLALAHVAHRKSMATLAAYSCKRTIQYAVVAKIGTPFHLKVH